MGPGRNFLIVVTDGQSYDDVRQPAVEAHKEGECCCADPKHSSLHLCRPPLSPAGDVPQRLRSILTRLSPLCQTSPSTRWAWPGLPSTTWRPSPRSPRTLTPSSAESSAGWPSSSFRWSEASAATSPRRTNAPSHCFSCEVSNWAELQSLCQVTTNNMESVLWQRNKSAVYMHYTLMLKCI